MTWTLEVAPGPRNDTKQKYSSLRRNLASDVQNLPPSAIKTCLLEKVGIVLTEYPPYSVRYSTGLQQAIPEVIVAYDYSARGDGNFTLIGPDTKPTHGVLADTEIQVPLVVGISQRDLASSGLSRLPNGNPSHRFILPGSINPELQPVMGIARPYLRTEEGILIQGFRFIRLASRWILEQTFLDQALKSMEQNGIASKIPAVNIATGIIEAVEAGPYAIIKTVEQGGRIDKILNYASMLLAISAAKGTRHLDHLVSDKAYDTVLSEVGDADYGTTEEEFLYNTVRKTFMTKSLRQVPFPGDLKRIP